MAVVWLGVVLFIVSLLASRIQQFVGTKVNVRLGVGFMRVLAVLMVLGGLVSSTIVMVPAGYRGVLMRFGAVTGSLPEGINFVMPYVNTVEMMEVRTQKEASEASAASKDMQIVSTSLALNFHIDPSQAGELYRKVGVDYKSRIIDPAVQESIKMVTANYTAEQLIKNRAAVKAEVESDITRRLVAYNIVVEPSGLSITNFNFSKEFNAAIEAKQVAQQEAEQQKYVLQKAELEQQTSIAKAKGTAESARLNAVALQANGGSKVLAREWIDKWDGHLPQVGGGGNYIIDINSLIKAAENK